MAGDNEIIVVQNPHDVSKIPQYVQTIPVNVYHFYIIDEIGDPLQYLDLINILKTAEEHDTIFIYLNTPGGSLQTSIQIIGAIRQCAGTVVTCLEGEVCSAGTLIFLVGDRHIVNANCTFMIHNYSQWIGGKGNEVALRVKYSEQYFSKLANDMYAGFLTPDEIKLVMEGKDFWMDSDEVTTRLVARNEIMSLSPSEALNEKLTEITEKFSTSDKPDVGVAKPIKKQSVRQNRRKTDSSNAT
jgi:ATP-dependent protease ClpP protease subunit